MDDFQKAMAEIDANIKAAEARTVESKREGCQHANLPVKYDSADCAGKDSAYVRKHYPRFYGNCPDCGVHMLGYASSEHYYAGDW